MSDVVISCPECKADIKLTESLAAPVVAAAKKKFEDAAAQKERAFAEREAALNRRATELEAASENVEERVQAALKAERAKITEAEAKKAKQHVLDDIQRRDGEISELKELLRTSSTKLAEAQKAQADAVRKQRELDDAKREIDLTIEKRVNSQVEMIQLSARKEADEAASLKIVEKDQTIAAMQRQIQELQRRAEQGSQQAQGEALEVALETLLRSNFGRDAIEPVPKGEFGGDIVQHVFGAAAEACGTILWESKRTKTWSDAWLPKLRDDQRTAHADAAIIVSKVLPKGVETFALIDGVWVTHPRCALPVAVALRESLIGLFAARKTGEGQATKTEMVYRYLTGPRFRHRVEAIVEKFSELQIDLDRERKLMTRLWAKREEQIRGVLEATAGMYGDLQGIAGRSLAEIEGLSVPLLDPPPSEALAS